MSDIVLEEEMLEPIIEQQLPKKKRRFVPYLILTILFVIGLTVFFLIPYEAPSLTDPDMPWFSIKDGVLQYDAALYTGTEELNVPKTVAGQTVTSIGGGCFAGDNYITTVKLPETVRVIGQSAFADCTRLRGIFIPESVTEISAAAFRGCAALESICIPYSVTTIGSDAFDGCVKLAHIFYTGPHASWAALYNEPISDVTSIYTANGTVKQKDIAAAANS